MRVVPPFTPNPNYQTTNPLLSPPQYDARKLQSLTWHRLYRSNSYPTPARLHPSDDWNTTVNSIKSNPQKRAVMYEETNCNRNNPLMLLGVRRIYQYIYFKLETYKLITLLDMPINTLDIGTFNDLCCVQMDTNLKEIVATFSETGVTTLPVINHQGRFTYLLDTKLLFNLVLECPTKVRINVADVLKFDPEAVANEKTSCKHECCARRFGNKHEVRMILGIEDTSHSVADAAFVWRASRAGKGGVTSLPRMIHAFQPERQLTRVVYETDSLRHVITKLHDCNTVWRRRPHLLRIKWGMAPPYIQGIDDTKLTLHLPCQAHNVVVLNSEQKVTGIITITDMLLFLGFSVGAFKKTFKWAPIKTVD
eukprot:sb/3465928/